MRALLIFLLYSISAVAAESPSFETVAKKALAYAHLEASTIHSWEKNVRKAPLLPRLQFGFERRLKNDLNINVEDSVAVNSSGIAVGPPRAGQALDTNNDMNFEVKAVWYFDQLLFSKDDLEISQEARYLNLERERLLEQVRHHYFQREKLLADRNASRIELAEVTAALDSLTGGWFSENLGEGK